jgi:salicylate hydroxylase
MVISSAENKIKIAIVGAGPGGLAAAINLLRLPFVDLSVYDQTRELREVGAVRIVFQLTPVLLLNTPRQGISIQQNTWRLLQLLGAAEQIEQYVSRGDGSKVAGEQRSVTVRLVLSYHDIELTSFMPQERSHR